MDLYETLAEHLAITKPWNFDEVFRANEVATMDILQWLVDINAVARAIKTKDDTFDKASFIAKCKGRDY